MEEITKLIVALGQIQITTKTIIFAIMVGIGIIIVKFIDDNKFNKYYNDMKNEKNKEIERLADDNRRYRDIYLKSLGIDQKQIDDMSAVSLKKEV